MPGVDALLLACCSRSVTLAESEPYGQETRLDCFLSSPTAGQSSQDVDLLERAPTSAIVRPFSRRRQVKVTALMKLMLRLVRGETERALLEVIDIFAVLKPPCRVG